MVPESISNSSKLIDLELSYNYFSGSIPRSLGNLRYLQLLSMQNNTLHYEPSVEEPSIIDFLTRFRYLRELRITFNPLIGGALSTSVGNLSSAFEIFVAAGCGLKGNIPTQIGNLRNLIELTISFNDLFGFIPTTLDRLQQLQKLELDNNKLRGPLPTSLCRLRNLGLLSLSFNQMSDGIPECLSNLSFLRELYIDHNRFSFGIPQSFWDLKGLLRVDMSANSLNGSLSVDVVKFEDVIHLNLSNNQFSGNIPPSVTEMQNLEILLLANNKLQGPIPEFKEPTIALEFLDISHNTLTGVIPKSLENLKNLKYLNLSFNNLSGEIPSGGSLRNLTRQSFMFNEALCGSPRFGVPTCPSPHPHSRNKKVFVLLGALSLLFFIVIAFLLVRRYRKKNISQSETDQLFLREPTRISYYELVQATASFSQSNLLGSGSFGSVYKGILNSGMVVAIKVFNQSEHAQRSLEVECQVLKNLRHRNLTKIITGCFGDNFKALVIEYMPNGNLEEWLYSETNFLNILQRLNIMMDVASALEYLHYGYFTPVAHCDIKPSNVLLDEEMVAHVSDFSITKLFAGEDETFLHTKTLATLGYMAPEYGTHGRVSISCDVYSFGIMMMEMFSRKKPTDEMFTEEMSLTSWVRDALPYPGPDFRFLSATYCMHSMFFFDLFWIGRIGDRLPDIDTVVSNWMDRPPLLDGNNFSFRKARMEIYLQAQGARVWRSVITSWTPPTKNGLMRTTVCKPVEEWSINELSLSDYNSKALNSIVGSLYESVFTQVTGVKEAKKVWEILQTRYEGTDDVKQSNYEWFFQNSKP
ncbi:PREDICTED: probable LRR receptor-like serine/threonine-protein kinase At3g47570 [Ipomoea nil]|uniref:probable LRR receptor-like serine/threonine-protein kinase At3g47570 n=1 Tax=Ipomoea nil TaxID=35883 RepID=UPI0009011EAE|nr:PREDICTED: probable LRR receptor-like serine/threonine-protein kinase At3g47570 [Ipomoea nil]